MAPKASAPAAAAAKPTPAAGKQKPAAESEESGSESDDKPAAKATAKPAAAAKPAPKPAAKPKASAAADDDDESDDEPPKKPAPASASKPAAKAPPKPAAAAPAKADSDDADADAGAGAGPRAGQKVNATPADKKAAKAAKKAAKLARIEKNKTKAPIQVSDKPKKEKPVHVPRGQARPTDGAAAASTPSAAASAAPAAAPATAAAPPTVNVASPAPSPSAASASSASSASKPARSDDPRPSPQLQPRSGPSQQHQHQPRQHQHKAAAASARSGSATPRSGQSSASSSVQNTPHLGAASASPRLNAGAGMMIGGGLSSLSLGPSALTRSDSGGAGKPGAGGSADPSRKKAGGQSKVRPSVLLQYDDPKRYQKHAKQSVVQRQALQKEKQVALFSHLPQFERMNSLSLQVGFSSEEQIHPAIVRLGLQYANGSITGSNARCVALLQAIKDFLADYHVPPNEVISRDLQTKLKPLIHFLIDCRPQSTSMGNAIRYLKMKIAKLSPSLTEAEAKAVLIGKINSFVHERIELADQVITTSGAAKINTGDVILTHAKSHVVESIIRAAWAAGRRFRVIVCDSRPKLEGRQLLKRLVEAGIPSTYIYVSSVGYVIKQVTKVFVGAYACLSNGAVISRIGCAVVGMMAHAHNIPVLVCCETYKFHERVQMDSICFNELGDPNHIALTDTARAADTSDHHPQWSAASASASASASAASAAAQTPGVLSDWRGNKHLKLLNLVYDLMPAEFVTMVITEVGMIPPTSIPVILREYHHESGSTTSSGGGSAGGKAGFDSDEKHFAPSQAHGGGVFGAATGGAMGGGGGGRDDSKQANEFGGRHSSLLTTNKSMA